MVPAVSLDMTLRVGEALNEEGVMAVLLGPLTGTPYKVYAVQAFHAGIGPGEFLLISVPARLARFLLVTVISHHVVAWLSRWHPFRSRGRVLLIAWLMFYALFFLLMPW